jgi:predicted dehydrogenase
MRVLFCGLGGIGQRHLRNLRSLRGAALEVHAFRVRGNRQKLRDDLTIDPEADLEADYGVIVHADLVQALSTRPDAVFVCNPSSLHAPIALAAAEAGAHLFIEKPVSNSMAGLDDLLSIVRRKNLVCHIGYNFRFHPALIRMKELIDAKSFGNILTVIAEIGEYLPNWHKYEDYRGMYAAREDLGGGVILSQIHEMDLIYWFFGLPTAIACRGGKLSNLDIDVEDTASSLMQVQGSHGQFPIALHQDFLQRPPVRTFRVIGDEGKAELDLMRNVLMVHGAQGEVLQELTFPGFKRNDMFLQQCEHFLACIGGNERPRVDLYAGIQSLRMAIAAKQSLARGGVQIELA